MLTQRITVGLISVVLAFGGCASFNPPPLLSQSTIRALILSKTTLRSSQSQVRAFLSHHDPDVTPVRPDHPGPFLRRTDGQTAELHGGYFVRGNAVGITWEFADGRHLSDVQVERFVQ